MIGHRFTEFIPDKDENKSTFDNLLDIFMQLITVTSGDVSEALSWMTNLDKQYNIIKICKHFLIGPLVISKETRLKML